MDKTIQQLVNNHVTVDLGIKAFKRLLKNKIVELGLPKNHYSDVLSEFKKNQWATYHNVFPEDNSSVPTHSHNGIDKPTLV